MVTKEQAQTHSGDTATFKGQETVLAGACEGLAGRHHCVEHDFTAAHNMDADEHEDGTCRWVWLCPEHGPEGTA